MDAFRVEEHKAITQLYLRRHLIDYLPVERTQCVLPEDIALAPSRASQ